MTDLASPIASPLKKTALNAATRIEAKMVDFGGWDMPVEIPRRWWRLIAEHLAVRTSVVCSCEPHGRDWFRGPGALAAVQHSP